jgi:hypothetical protein
MVNTCYYYTYPRRALQHCVAYRGVVQRQRFNKRSTTSQTPWHFLAQVHFSTRFVFRFGLLNTIRSVTQLQLCVHHQRQNQASSPTVKCAAESGFPQYVCRFVDYDIHSPSQLPSVLLYHHPAQWAVIRRAYDDAELYAR